MTLFVVLETGLSIILADFFVMLDSLSVRLTTTGSDLSISTPKNN